MFSCFYMAGIRISPPASFIFLPVPEFVRFPIRPCFCYTYPILKEAQMNADDKSKLKAYEELIGSLEHTNGLQHRGIETQSSLIKSLEEHNAELEKIIDDLTNI